MNILRQAVKDYLSLRRSLGFKLLEAGKGLLDFVTFMERRHASYITSALALAWAQQPVGVQPAHWARRLCFVRGFARHHSATDQRTEIPPYQPVDKVVVWWDTSWGFKASNEYGDGQARRSANAGTFVDCAYGIGFGSGASVL